MNVKHSTTNPTATDARPLWRQVAAARRDAFVIGFASVVISGGAIVLAWLLDTPYPLLLWVVALVFGVYARHLDGYAQRAAEALPAKPTRSQPRWFMRFYWWLARKQVQRAARPKPWRGVKVDGVEDAIKLPYRKQEMAQAVEPVIVHGYTASDVYMIVCEAATRGLGERAWQLDKRIVKLPSGQTLSREGFRDVQRWLVSKRLAVSQPHYQLTVTPEAVADALSDS